MTNSDATLLAVQGTAAMRLAWHLTHNREEAQDLVHETNRRVVWHWSSYDRKRSLPVWFRAILRNLFLDNRKRYEERNVFSMDAPSKFVGEPSLGDTIPDKGEGILEYLERREAVEMVRRALGRMRKPYRIVLALCDMGATPYKRAARELGIPLNTLRSRLHRARQDFRKRLKEYMESGTPVVGSV